MLIFVVTVNQTNVCHARIQTALSEGSNYMYDNFFVVVFVHDGRRGESIWIDDIPDGGIKTKNKTNNSDCELNDTRYSSTTMAPYDQWRRYDSASLSN